MVAPVVFLSTLCEIAPCIKNIIIITIIIIIIIIKIITRTLLKSP